MAAKPIEMVYATNEAGGITPLRMKLTDGRVIKIDRINSLVEEKLAGNEMSVFMVEGILEEQLVTALLKYERRTCVWWLFKLSNVRKN